MMKMLLVVSVSSNIVFLGIVILLFKKYLKYKVQNSISNDINELKQAYLDRSHDIVFMKDENLKYIFVNKNFEKFNNIEASQLIGNDDFDILDEETANDYRRIDLEVLDKKDIVVNESSSGEKVLRTTKFPVRLLNDRYGIGAYVEDVTEEYISKKQLELVNEILNKSNNLLSAILESSPEIIVFALDTDYCYISFNRKHKELMKEIYGIEIEIGMSMLDLKYNDPKIKEDIDKALRGESFKKIECYENENPSIWQEYYSPMYSNDGTIIGLTCFVLNITDRIKAEEKIAYLSYHDALTGLYNRRFFEEELSRLDVEKNLPISIIVGDMNGLKLTNDIFGHVAGDLLLQKVARVLKNCFRSDDIVARVGGDEFVVLLPKTKNEDAKEIISRVKNEVYKESVKSIRGSLSMGCATKTHRDEDIMQTLENAEIKMYSAKTLESEEFKANTIKTIIETLHQNCAMEKEHSTRVSLICESIGRKMMLPEPDIRKLKKAGYLHDIGKITLSENDLKLDIDQHPITGYRILNLFDDTFDLAECVIGHHENWDGTGYPKGLKGEEIPILARILSIAEAYDELTYHSDINHNYEEAIEKIVSLSGTKFDPYIVDIFAEVIKDIRKSA